MKGTKRNIEELKTNFTQTQKKVRLYQQNYDRLFEIYYVVQLAASRYLHIYENIDELGTNNILAQEKYRNMKHAIDNKKIDAPSTDLILEYVNDCFDDLETVNMTLTIQQEAKTKLDIEEQEINEENLRESIAKRAKQPIIDKFVEELPIYESKVYQYNNYKQLHKNSNELLNDAYRLHYELVSKISTLDKIHQRNNFEPFT